MKLTPEGIQAAIEADDGLCGPGKFNLGENDPLRVACEAHDAHHLYQKLTGELDEPIAKTQVRLAGQAFSVTMFNLVTAVRSVVELPFVVVGGIVGGTTIQLIRLVRKEETKKELNKQLKKGDKILREVTK